MVVTRLFAKRPLLSKIRQFNSHSTLTENEVEAYLNKVMEYQEIHGAITALLTAVDSYQTNTFGYPGLRKIVLKPEIALLSSVGTEIIILRS